MTNGGLGQIEPTRITVDEDVRAVLEFMQRRFSVSRLVGVAEGVARLAPNLWGHHQPEKVFPLALEEEPPKPSIRRKPKASISPRPIEIEGMAL